MEFDQEAHDKILIMAEDIKFIREQLSDGRETFKEHKKMFKGQDNRIRIVEQNQQLLTGKIAIIIMGIGATILGASHILIWVLEMVRGR